MKVVLNKIMEELNFPRISEEINHRKRIIGRKIYYHDVLESTMTEAKALANSNCEEGTVVIAGRQTGGRGRIHRNWISPEGGIWMSVILYPNLSPCEVPLITLAAGVAICTFIEQLYKVCPGLKWPNDVLLNGKKICGILTEGKLGPNGLDYCILGIGLNLNFDKACLPDELKEYASTVVSETGIQFNSEEVLKFLLLELGRTYNCFISGKEKIISLWESYSITLGQNVSAFFDNHTITGTAIRISEKGSLIILDEISGKEVEVNSGEVSIRPKL